MTRRHFALLMACMAASILTVVLAASLPADAFFVGDPGVKLVATRAVLEHPSHPLNISPPVVEGVAMPDLMDPFFVPHDDHAHAVTSPVFPLMTAPFYAAFGLRGLYVLPAIGFISALLGLTLIATRLGCGAVGSSVIWLGLAMSPLMFYGLEFWEHTVAASLAYFGTGMFLSQKRGVLQMVASGALIGAAVVMRPEAVWYATALLLADRCLPQRAGGSLVLAFLLGACLPLLPLLAYNAIHLGTLTGAHLGANIVHLDSGWLRTRVALAREWLWPETRAAVAGVGLTLTALGLLSAAGTAGRTRRLVGLAGAVVLALLAARHALPVDSLWAVFPAVLLMALPSATSQRRFLNVLVAADVILVLATAPNDGGGQWGPRYLLLASGPAILSVWYVLADVWKERRPLEIVMAMALVGASAAVQRQSFKELRATKQGYGSLQRLVGAAAHGGAILTDIWWLDQVTGAYSPRPVFLFSPFASIETVPQRLIQVGLRSLVVVTPTSADDQSRVASWLKGTPFRIRSRSAIHTFSLTVFYLAV